MSVFDTEENIKNGITVKDFYDLEVINLGMSGSLEEEAKKMFKVSLDEMIHELNNTPLKKFERLFFKPRQWRIKNIDGFYMQIDLEGIRELMLKWFLRRMVKKKYRSGYNSPFCSSSGDYKFINIYNGEVIEWATGANMLFKFKHK